MIYSFPIESLQLFVAFQTEPTMLNFVASCVCVFSNNWYFNLVYLCIYVNQNRVEHNQQTVNKL